MSIKWPKVILFGDSQIQRSFEPTNGLWGSLLANRFQRVCDVLPRGCAGYTSRSCRNLLPYLFTPENTADIAAFVIFVGTNDSSGRIEEYEVSVEEYCMNIEAMIKYLQDIGVSTEKIIVITPGAGDIERFLEKLKEFGRTDLKCDGKDLPKYVEGCEDVAKKYKIDVVNLYQEMMKDEDWSKYLVDGVHLSKEGSHLLYGLLFPLIEKRFNNTAELLCPYWKDVNAVKPNDMNEDISKKMATRIIYEEVSSDKK